MFHGKITSVCRDCSQKFTAPVGEPKFFAGRGFTSAPFLCPACCNARKVTQEGLPGGNLGGPYSGGGPHRSQYEMYPVVCSECGKATQMPFLPRRGQPFCCSDCFVTKRPLRAVSSGRAW